MTELADNAAASASAGAASSQAGATTTALAAVDNVMRTMVGTIDDQHIAAAKARVEGLRARNPGATADELAEKAIRQKCIDTGGVGVASSLPGLIPGIGSLVVASAGLVVDIRKTMEMQKELVLELAAIYDREITPADRRNLLLLVGGVDSGNKLVVKAAGELTAKLSLKLWLYNDVIVDTFFSAPTALAARVIGSYDSVGIVDQIIFAGDDTATLLLQKGGVINGLSYSIAGFAVYLLVGLTAVYTMFLLALSRIALSVLLALGPLFFALLMFDTTKRFFEAWIAQLADRAALAAPIHRRDGKAPPAQVGDDLEILLDELGAAAEQADRATLRAPARLPDGIAHLLAVEALEGADTGAARHGVLGEDDEIAAHRLKAPGRPGRSCQARAQAPLTA